MGQSLLSGLYKVVASYKAFLRNDKNIWFELAREMGEQEAPVEITVLFFWCKCSLGPYVIYSCAPAVSVQARKKQRDSLLCL